MTDIEQLRAAENLKPRDELVDKLKLENSIIKAQNLKLKGLLLLTDSSVSDEVMNSIAIKQWNEYVRAFPSEGLIK